jgi:hypothetical protein
LERAALLLLVKVLEAVIKQAQAAQAAVVRVRLVRI